MSLSENVLSRLENWKFERACHYLKSESDESDPTDFERSTIIALSDSFGDVGWFYGSMSGVVRAAVRSLGVRDE